MDVPQREHDVSADGKLKDECEQLMMQLGCVHLIFSLTPIRELVLDSSLPLCDTGIGMREKMRCTHPSCIMSCSHSSLSLLTRAAPGLAAAALLPDSLYVSDGFDIFSICGNVVFTLWHIHLFPETQGYRAFFECECERF
jgi:hypothetical protein